MKFPKLSLRDLFAVVTMVAILVAWWVDHRSMERRYVAATRGTEAGRDGAQLRALEGQSVVIAGVAVVDKAGLCMQSGSAYLVIRDANWQPPPNSRITAKGRLVYKEWAPGWFAFGLESPLVEVE